MAKCGSEAEELGDVVFARALERAVEDLKEVGLETDEFLDADFLLPVNARLAEFGLKKWPVVQGGRYPFQDFPPAWRTRDALSEELVAGGYDEEAADVAAEELLSAYFSGTGWYGDPNSTDGRNRPKDVRAKRRQRARQRKSKKA